jgi:hypothetical protein
MSGTKGTYRNCPFNPLVFLCFTNDLWLINHKKHGRAFSSTYMFCSGVVAKNHSK